MSVAGEEEILGRGAEIDRRHRFGDQVAGVAAQDVDAEDRVRLGVGQDLDEALEAACGAGAADGPERKRALAVGGAGFLQLLFRPADGGDFGFGVDDAGDRVVVDVDMAAGDALDAGHALLLGLVGELRPADHVADREHA